MAHFYAIDADTYCRVATRQRMNVFEDGDVVDGNLEFLLEWNGGYIEHSFDGTAGQPISQSRQAGFGMSTRAWDDGVDAMITDGAGGVRGAFAWQVQPLGNNGSEPWKARSSPQDMSFRVTLGTTGAGVAMRGIQDACFMVYVDRSSLRVKVDRRNSGTTNVLTGTTALTAGQNYLIRVTETANLWTVYVDGVSQGTFTDSALTSDHRCGSVWFRDTDSVVSEVKFLPSAACPATSYEVINDSGAVIASGALAASDYRILVADADLVQRDGRGPYGGYKLRLYGASVGNYGTAKGDCQFVRVAPADNFPTKPTKYDTGPTSTEWDLPLRCFFALGATRIEYDDAAEAKGQYLLDNYRAYELPNRPRHSIVSFNDLSPDDTATMTASVNALKHVYDAWEPLNEPNYSSYTGATWVAKQALFHDAVKAADPTAIVLGPNPVAYNWNFDIPWIKPFLDGDGADYLDEFSVHGYNCTNGDIHMSRYLLGQLHAQTDPYNLTLWQTEQSFFSQFQNVSTPLQSLTWLAVQLMVQETCGIPLERNVLWYDKSHGFSYTSFWEHGTGITSVPVMVRTMVAELGNRVFDSEYDLGDMGDAYVCAKWADATTAVVGVLAQSNNLADVRFFLTGATSVVCVDAYGNEFTLNASGSIVTIPARNLPHWVRLPAGVDLELVAADWVFGTNHAVGSTVTSSTANQASVYALPSLVSQFLENNYMFTDGNPGSSSVHTMQDTSQILPQTITVDLLATQTVGRIDLFAPPIWQTFYSTPIDFDIDVSVDGSTWTTVFTGEPPTPVTSSAFVSNRDGANTVYDMWYDPDIAWDVTFTNQPVRYVRLVIRAASYGAFETVAASEAMFGSGAWQQATSLRGLRVYENYVPYDPDRPRFNMTVTCSG